VEFDFEQFIRSTTSKTRVDRLRACVFWEFARESPTFCYIPALGKALDASTLTSDDKYRLWKFRMGRVRGFPDTPWQEVGVEVQDDVVRQLFSPHVMVYGSLEKGRFALDETIRQRIERGELPLSGMVIVVTESSWRNHGREQIRDEIYRKLLRPNAGSSTEVVTTNPWHGFNRHHLQSALRTLGYCRVRTHSEQHEADKWLESLRSGGAEVKIRDWEDARKRAQEWFRRLFPWLPPEELPKCARSISDRHSKDNA
jgi:hypothetical protein